MVTFATRNPRQSGKLRKCAYLEDCWVPCKKFLSLLGFEQFKYLRLQARARHARHSSTRQQNYQQYQSPGLVMRVPGRAGDCLPRKCGNSEDVREDTLTHAEKLQIGNSNTRVTLVLGRGNQRVYTKSRDE